MSTATSRIVAPGGPDQLALADADLEVHAPQRPAPGPGVVVLHELLGDPQPLQRIATEGLDKEASLVAVDVGSEVDEAGEAGRDGSHHRLTRISANSSAA